MPYQIRFLIFFSFLFLVETLEASHIRAGEVIARRISARQYEFTFIGYRDIDGVEFGNEGIFSFGDGDFFGDDPEEIIPWITPVDLGNGVERWQFSVRHTYQTASNYLVSFTDNFRNADIQNISGSDATPFHVETLVVIDPLISNSTPFFTVPPIDQAIVGAVFEHNPGAFDPDGDSLAYFFTTPKQDQNVLVSGYQSLTDASFYDNFGIGNSTGDGIPELSIDPITGTLIWNAPGGATIEDRSCREFNVAFVVEEWRTIRGITVRLGFVTRDMQIIVCDFENNPPELTVPEDTCIVAGNTLLKEAIATDPDGDQVAVEAFGGPFEVESPATFSPNPAPFQNTPAAINVEWETICGHVRVEPYDIQFKATDKPNIPEAPNLPGLVDFETFRVTVVGPAPEGLLADGRPGRSMQLTWDPYSCSNADSMQVWRRVGELDLDLSCNPGIPESAGYELLETLPIADTAFLDRNEPIGLAAGSKYCYRLVATFPEPAGGLSIPSEQACDSLLIDVPVITNVDIRNTSLTDGTIDVVWVAPLQIDQSQFPPPYEYEVLRSESTNNSEFVPISNRITDLSFRDAFLNTKDEVYFYKIILYDNTNAVVDTSQQASSVRLEPRAQVGGINLSWESQTPWSITVQDFPLHKIYRDRVLADFPDSLVEIGVVDVTIDGLSFFDDGSFNGVDLETELDYCYYVETQGSYGNDLLPEPLINRSQIICAQPNDTIPPCEPVSILFDESNDCTSQTVNTSCNIQNSYFNAFSWSKNDDPTCDDDIISYKIYFSPTGQEGTFSELAETRNTEFRHENLASLAGCYYLTAVDRSRNESVVSEIVCNDNCPRFELPNVFTPNGDGKNDTFRPFEDQNRCPRFVQSVVLRILSRDGIEVYSYDSRNFEDNIFFEWDGKNDRGVELSAGTYFYSAEVNFVRLNPASEGDVITGWIQLIK